MLTRINSLEKNINDLLELKNSTRTSRSIHKFHSQIGQAEERISEIEYQHNELKQEDRIRKKRMKKNEETLQEMWDYLKRPNLHSTGVPESDKKNGIELENTLQDIIQENFPNLAR